jgi:DUF1009 family protein
MRDNLQPIAIFAGRGSLPKMLIEDCQKNGRKFLLFLLKSEIYEIDYSGFEPIKLDYGAIEEFLEIVKKNQIQNLVFVGGVTKPNFSQLKVGKKGAVLLAKIFANKILGWEPFYSQLESIRSTFDWWEKFNTTTLTVNDLIIKVVIAEPDLTKTQDENLAPDYNKTDYQMQRVCNKNPLMRYINYYYYYYLNYNRANCLFQIDGSTHQ